MITNKNSIASKGWDKISTGRKQQKRMNDDRQQDIEDEDDEDKGNNGIY